MPGAVADHGRASAERTALDFEDMGAGGGGTSRVRAVGDQQLACVKGGDAAVVAEPGSACRAKVGPTVRHRVVPQ
jgi:hypothetical protein